MPLYWKQSCTHPERLSEVETPHTNDLSKASLYISPPPPHTTKSRQISDSRLRLIWASFDSLSLSIMYFFEDAKFFFSSSLFHFYLFILWFMISFLNLFMSSCKCSIVLLNTFIYFL